MFKKKITRRLCLYFSLAILFFALIVGGIFVILFQNYIITTQRAELLHEANSISSSIKEFFKDEKFDINSHSTPKGKSGIGGYIRLLDKITDTNIWIIDKNKKLIIFGPKLSVDKDITDADIPKNAHLIIEDIFKGKSSFSNDFSSALNEPTLTVGVPIKGSSGDILGVVLLHAPVKGVTTAIHKGIALLFISSLIAFILVIFLSIFLSYSFTRPLNLMNRISLKLVQGEYTAKNNIQQEDEIGELANTLDLLADRLYKASKESEQFEMLRREFFANISHELKTPVAVMSGSLQALVDEVVTDKALVNEYHLQMLNESKYLSRLIGDLLDLSKLSNTDFIIEKTKISLYELLEDVIRSARFISKEKNIEITLNLDTDNYVLEGDYGRLRQMLLIILDNAIKFSKPYCTVEISLVKNILSIKDYGLGIAESDLPHIFEKFYKSRSEENKCGTGLGLSIAKQIAVRHNIDLTCESKVNFGTKFIFKIT